MIKQISKVTYKKKQIVFARDNWICQYCYLKPSKFHITTRLNQIYIIPMDSNNRFFEIDHIKAKSNGGDNDINNLVTSCHNCNNNKSNRKYKIKKNFPKVKLVYIIQ